MKDRKKRRADAITHFFLASILFSLALPSLAGVDTASVEMVGIPSTRNLNRLDNAFTSRGGASVATEGTRGERIQFYVALRASLDTSVEVSCLPLEAEPQAIPASACHLRHVVSLYQAATARRYIVNDPEKRQNAVLVPLLLLNDPELFATDPSSRRNRIRIAENPNRYRDISGLPVTRNRHVVGVSIGADVHDAKTFRPRRYARNESGALFVEIDIPEEAVAGRYIGALVAQENGREIGRLEIELTVRDWGLQESQIEHFVYYRGRLSSGHFDSLPDVYKTREALLADFRKMKSNGITNFAIYQSIDNRKAFFEYLALRLQAGFSNQTLFVIDPKAVGFAMRGDLAALSSRLRRLKSMLNANGKREIYLYGKDEANASELKKQQPALAVYRANGFKVFMAGALDNEEAIRQSSDFFIAANRPSLEAASRWRAQSKPIFSYDNPQAGVRNGVLYRQNYGLLLWAFGYDGAMPYAYQDGFGNIWDDSDHIKFRDHVFVYPLGDDGIDTIEWKSFFQGLVDLQYVATLSSALNNLESQARESCSAAVEARDYLHGLRVRIIALAGKDKRTPDLGLNLSEIRKNVSAFINDVRIDCY